MFLPPTAETSHSFGPNDKLPMFDLKSIDFPAVENYGYDHGKNTARLALVILSHAFPELNNQREQSVLWTAALFHDVGRSTPFGVEDANHAAQSAAILDKFIRGQDAYCHDVELRERACRLVARHHEVPDEPLAKVLADADAYEACRVLPGTSEGLRYLKARTATLHTEWAKSKSNLKTYMGHRGWT